MSSLKSTLLVGALIIGLLIGIAGGVFVEMLINAQTVYDLQNKNNLLELDKEYYENRCLEILAKLQKNNTTYVDTYYVGQFSGHTETFVFVKLYGDVDASKALQWAIDHKRYGMIDSSFINFDLTKEPIIIDH